MGAATYRPLKAKIAEGMRDVRPQSGRHRRGHLAAPRRRRRTVPARLARAMEKRGFAVETAESVAAGKAIAT
jgi:hypothetical protein